ncbi:uridine kinase [Saccharopolyspora sp. HNM0983]|uniref:Uridine kinase n=1 Tax=Saccharopolyspora montiporae TaxID=2781240 RepID=A0A929B808_9PSEU|nr:uridine kinase [Saccharopolyspora sp. HNM0983]MBE9373510.1 uridine kinase [Saccharopolyspora sp. HNM0983]
MQVRPLTPQRLVAEIVDHLDAWTGTWCRMAIDGAPAAGTAEFADDLVDPLRERGREAVRVSTRDYLRPASLRLEHGHRDPDSFYTGWFDLDGLRREVLDPLADGGSGLVLPALWDPAADRSPRRERIRLPERGVVLVDGPLLLGAGLPFDRTVHLELPEAALQRLTPDEQQWTLPAYRRYAAEVDPRLLAGTVVRTDRPGRPAVIDALS